MTTRLDPTALQAAVNVLEHDVDPCDIGSVDDTAQRMVEAYLSALPKPDQESRERAATAASEAWCDKYYLPNGDSNDDVWGAVVDAVLAVVQGRTQEDDK